jgi:hypothetical protein
MKSRFVGTVEIKFSDGGVYDKCKIKEKASKGKNHFLNAVTTAIGTIIGDYSRAVKEGKITDPEWEGVR